MRNRFLIVGSLLAAVSACGRSADKVSKVGASGPGLRRPGLWRQTVVRDGRPAVFGVVRMCIDDATDSKMTMIGHAAAGARCSRSAAKALDGSIRFHSTCSFGRGGVIESSGSVWSDFSSAYRLHADSRVRGSIYRPMNGVHVTNISAFYVGPCPSDMAPGEIIIGPGLKVNLDRLPLAGAAAALG